jgi:hypothetical protein
LTFLFWQTPHVFNFADFCKHLFILFIDSRSEVESRSV